ncbi:YqhR family membrane protein [Cohnella yongneupensis]|uniref:YqhR family membrane protein n=1 Tax=Cohnella yongneupensis TaxID=425006 RepID=A0ABW0R9N9_9BACL
MAAQQSDGKQDRRKDDGNTITAKALLHSLKIGLFAGIIWGLVRWLATGLNFTQVTQAYLLDPFVSRQLLGSGWWQFAGWIAFIVMSVLAAVVYWLVLGKLRGPWPGLAFGAVWWGVFYALIGPMIGAVPPLRTIGWDSMVADFCLYVVWGLFIGFSISFELHDEMQREPTKKSAQSSPQPST